MTDSAMVELLLPPITIHFRAAPGKIIPDMPVCTNAQQSVSSLLLELLYLLKNHIVQHLDVGTLHS